MIVSVIDKQRAVMISMAIGFIELVKSQEEPGSFRYNKLTAACESLARATNDYTGGGFQGTDTVKATRLIDKIEAMVVKEFSPPKVKRPTSERTRGRDGRFLA